MERDICIVGVNHRSAPVEVRERLAFVRNGALEAALKRLAGAAEIEEAAIVSTCNRVEVIACAWEFDTAIRRIEAVLSEEQSVAPGSFEPHLYRLRGREAVRHLFRVAASLDSMIVGEPQILGQLKASYAASAAVGTSRAVLHRCFHKAFAVAKRVRRETAIARRAVSVASAAVELTHSIFEDLEERTAMLVGAGEMSVLTARHLLRQGLRSLLVTNRTFDRAVEVARECSGTPVPFEQFLRYLHLADVVIGAAGADAHLLGPDVLQQTLRMRKQTPMFLIDLSVPRTFAPEINELDNVYLYDIDDLQKIAHTNQDERGREAVKAEAIVDAAVEHFLRWFGSLEMVPTIVALRQKVDDIRARELAKNARVLGTLTPEQQQAVEQVTGSIVNKIIHTPITRLRENEGGRGHATDLDAVHRLFGLREEEPDEDETAE
jgi:glutamyl-tRNA reductase